MGVGFFGKLLSHGDFVSRRLPADWIDHWDHWLQQGMSCSRQQLGAEWTDYYLVAPICRFLLGCGSVDQHAWAGIWMPSVDRVGRYYPLTLAAPISGTANLGMSYFANLDWFLRLEALALSSLAGYFEFADFDNELHSLAPPTPVTSVAEQVIPDSLTPFSAQLLSQFALSAQYPHCLWICGKQNKTDSDVRYSHGLPSQEVFSLLMGADDEPKPTA